MNYTRLDFSENVASVLTIYLFVKHVQLKLKINLTSLPRVSNNTKYCCVIIVKLDK